MEQHTEKGRVHGESRNLGLDENGPPWDRTRTRCGGGNAGNASRKCNSPMVFGAKCCQPLRGWKGSPVSSRTGGWMDRIASFLQNRRVDSSDQLEPAGQHAVQTQSALYSRTTTSWYSARITPLTPQGSDSDIPGRHDRVLLYCKSDWAEPFATNSWPWWQRKRTRGAKQTARHAPKVRVHGTPRCLMPKSWNIGRTGGCGRIVWPWWQHKRTRASKNPMTTKVGN